MSLIEPISGPKLLFRFPYNGSLVPSEMYWLEFAPLSFILLRSSRLSLYNSRLLRVRDPHPRAKFWEADTPLLGCRLPVES
jgi:hypothetical protein